MSVCPSRVVPVIVGAVVFVGGSCPFEQRLGGEVIAVARAGAVRGDEPCVVRGAGEQAGQGVGDGDGRLAGADVDRRGLLPVRARLPVLPVVRRVEAVRVHAAEERQGRGRSRLSGTPSWNGRAADAGRAVSDGAGDRARPGRAVVADAGGAQVREARRAGADRSADRIVELGAVGVCPLRGRRR